MLTLSLYGPTARMDERPGRMCRKPLSDLITQAPRVLAVASVLAPACFLYLWNLGAADFDPDEYNAIQHLGKPFSECFRDLKYGRLLVLQLWTLHRIFDGELYGYRIVGGVASILTVAALVYFSTRTWPKDWSVAVYAGTMLVFNKHLLHYGRWGMPNYGEQLLTSTIMLFLFKEMSGRTLPPRVLVPSILLFLLVPWIYFGLLIPSAVGLVLVLFFRYLDLPQKNVSAVGRLLSDLRALALLPLSFLIGRVADSSTPWNAAFRPSIRPYYFPFSDYSKDVSGMFSYSVHGLSTLVTDLVDVRFQVPFPEFGAFGYSWDYLLRIICLGLLLVGFVLTFVPQFSNRSRRFIAAFLILNFATTLALGLVGAYPYGNPRYFIYLIVPMLWLAGVGLRDVYVLIAASFLRLRKRRMRSRWLDRAFSWGTWITALTGLAAILTGATVSLQGYAMRWADLRERNDALIAVVRDSTADVILADSDHAYWMKARAPRSFQRAFFMGLGQHPSSEAPVPMHLQQLFKRSHPPIRTILTVTKLNGWSWDKLPEEMYPAYRILLEPGAFEIRESVSAGRFNASLLQRTSRGTSLPFKLAIRSAGVGHRGKFGVRGGALSPYEIGRVEVFSGGEFLGTADDPLYRSDVASQYPEYRTPRCGFRFVDRSDRLLRSGKLPGGLEVRVFGPDGLLGQTRFHDRVAIEKRA